MASSWLSQFADTLANIKTTPGAALPGASTPSAISQILSARAQDATPSTPFQGNPGFGDNLNNAINNASNAFNEKALSGGQHVLDFLGRTLNASAAFKDYELQHAPSNPLDFSSLPGAFGEALQGLEGNRKTTYSDVLQHQGVTNPWVKGIGGFAADVALDPMSLVGPGEVKAGAKLVDKGLQAVSGGKADIPGLLARLATPTNESDLITQAKDFAPAAKAATPSSGGSMAQQIIAAEQARLGLDGSKAVAPTADAVKLAQNTPLAESAGLAEKATPLAKTAEPFVEAPTPTPGTMIPAPAVDEAKAAIPNSAKLLEATATKTPTPLTTPAAVNTAKSDLMRAQLAHAAAVYNHDSLLKNVEVHAPQAVEDIAKPAVETAAPAVVEPGASAADTLKKGIVNLANENLNPALKQVNMLGRSGLPLQDISRGLVNVDSRDAAKAAMTVPAKVLLDAATTGKIPPGLENAYVKVGGQLTKLSDHLSQLHNDFKLGDVFGATRDAAPAVEKAVPAAIPTATKDFATMEELQAARKAKQLTPAAEAAYKAKLAALGIRSHTQLTASVKRAAAALEKAQGKLSADPLTKPAVAGEVAGNVSKVLKGEPSVVAAKEAAPLNENMAKAVQNITSHVHDYALMNPNTKRRAFDAFSQMTLGKKVMSEATRMIAGLPEKQRATALYDHFMPMLDASERIFRENGIPLILGKGVHGMPVSMHDILSALPRDFVEKYFLNRAAAPGITHMADIAEQFVKHALGDVPTADLRDSVKNIISQGMGKAGVKSPLAKAIEHYGNGDSVVNEFMRAFTQAEPKLQEALTRNATHDVIKDGLQTKALTDSVIQHVHDVIHNPATSVADIVKTALDTHNLVNSAADAAAIPKAGATRALTEQAVKAATADALSLPTVQVSAKAATKLAKATTKNEIVRVATELSKAAGTEVEAITHGDTLLHDLGTQAEFRSQVNYFRSLFPHFAMGDLRNRMLERFSVKQDRAKLFTAQLAKINSKFTTEQLSEAFRMLQDGRPVTTDAMRALSEAQSHLFTNENTSLGLLTRNFGKGEDVVKNIEQKLARYGLRGLKLDPQNLDASWKSWENVKDPLDLYSRFNAAVGHALAERELGAQLSLFFGRATPGADGQWVKIVDSTGKSKVASLIDTSLYYPQHVANEMHLLDDTLKEFMKPNSTNSLIRQWDAVMHSYKAGLTVWHVGHHVRNFVGDTWFSHMAGVTTPTPYYKALAAMATRASHYTGFDSIAAMNNAFKVDKGGSVPKTILTVIHKGQQYHLTPSQVYTMAFDRGLLHDYSMIEDLNFGHLNQSNNISEAFKKISPLRLIGQEGKLHAAAAKVSEHREHFVRLAHFIDYMSKNNHISGPDFETAMQAATSKAGDVVRKWHPDGTDMTPFERNKLRRVFTFYSWIRKAIPLVVESAVTRPGRFMVYPKAMHNLAASQGIQTNGMGNPFPTDQLFPNYIADSTQGPQWGHAGSYAGIKPGVPSVDILDQYGSPMSALQTTASSLNPAMKIPLELAAGHEFNGVPITSTPKYIDQQIPYGNILDQLTGRLASTGFTQPAPVAKSNAGYAGNPNAGGNLRTLINQLTGSSVTDYSSPSTIKNGQLDLKKRLKGG